VRRLVAMIMVAMAMAALPGAGPVFAQANSHASCVGAAHSNQVEPGEAGQFHRAAGSTFGVNGQISSHYAHFAPVPGQGRHTRGELSPGLISCRYITP